MYMCLMLALCVDWWAQGNVILSSTTLLVTVHSVCSHGPSSDS